MVIKSYHIILAVKMLGCFLLKWVGFGELLGWKSSTRSGNTAHLGRRTRGDKTPTLFPVRGCNTRTFSAVLPQFCTNAPDSLAALCLGVRSLWREGARCRTKWEELELQLLLAGASELGLKPNWSRCTAAQTVHSN